MRSVASRAAARPPGPPSAPSATSSMARSASGTSTLPLVDRRGQPGDAELGGMPAPVVGQPLQRRQGPGFVQHAILEFRCQQRQRGPEPALARQRHRLSPAGPGACEVAARRGQPTAEEQQAGPGVVCRRRLLDHVQEPRGRLGRLRMRYRPRPAATQARRAAPADRRRGAAAIASLLQNLPRQRPIGRTQDGLPQLDVGALAGRGLQRLSRRRAGAIGKHQGGRLEPPSPSASGPLDRTCAAAARLRGASGERGRSPPEHAAPPRSP